MTLKGCKPMPPKAKKKPKRVAFHGEALTDDYHWLRDRSDPDTLEYIEAENRYTEEAMQSTEGLQKELYEELVTRTIETDSEPPVRMGEFHYYNRTEKGKQYPIYCRRRISGGEEQIVLDQNAIAEKHDFFQIGEVKVSSDHKIVAYSYDTTGAEYYRVRFMDIESQEACVDMIEATGGFEWGSSSRTVYYFIHDDVHRPYRVLRHILGTRREQDEIVYEEPDPGCEYMALKKSKSKAFLFVTTQTLTTGEVNFLRGDDDSGVFKPVIPRKTGVRYYVLHRGNDFLMVTNEDAPNFRIIRTPSCAMGSENWEDVLPHEESRIIDISDPNPWVDVFDDYLAVFEREDAISSIRILSFRDGSTHVIDLPERLRSVTPLENPVMSSTVLRFAYTSMTMPERIYEYDMERRELVLVKDTEIPGYDPHEYHSERVYVAAADGTKIPLNIVHRKGVLTEGRNPLLLYAYGAAGDFEGSAPAFDIGILSLLERGFVYAVAAIRGGGEYGQQWYDDGRMMNKKNCFSDFISCAEYLIENGFTSSDRIAINGGSAGGLLVAVATTMRPELFHTVLAEVPFVDVLNTMMDQTIPLVTGEYEEYGDINEPEVYSYCRSYSPYDNIRRQEYPNILVTTAMNDPRVAFWEPVKWIAKLREHATGESLILLRTARVGGHMEQHARYDALRSRAFKLAFLVSTLTEQRTP